MRAALGGFRHAEPVTSRDPRPAVNGRGYVTTPAKPGLSRHPTSPIDGASLRSPAASALGGFRHADPVTSRDPRPAVNGRGYVTTPAKPGWIVRVLVYAPRINYGSIVYKSLNYLKLFFINNDSAPFLNWKNSSTSSWPDIFIRSSSTPVACSYERV